MTYNKTHWVDKQAPFLEAKHLNNIEDGIGNANNALDKNTVSINKNTSDILKNAGDILDNTNKITAISTGETHKGVWTPTSGTEYPSTPVKGDSWYIGKLTSPYTFTGGDLNGKMANNQDKIIYSGTSWSLIEKLHIPDEVVVRVSTVNDFGTVDNTKYPTAIAEEAGRGGIFNYDPSKVSDNDGATVFDGWVRKYDGAVELKSWTGALGDGTDSIDVFDKVYVTTQYIDGQGGTYKATTKPDFTKLSNITIKVGNVSYFSKDNIRTKTSKITNGNLYTSWAQDSSYTKLNQLCTWVMETESHADGDDRIVQYTSDDGGVSWSTGQYLNLINTYDTLWSAGIDNTHEYLIVRRGSTGANSGTFTYFLHKKILPSGMGGNGDYNTYNFVVTPIAFPDATHAGSGVQPMMIHSFTFNGANTIVVGASYGTGASLMSSDDGGDNWTHHELATGGEHEEPTVKYDAVSQKYYGFIRQGNTNGGNPWFYILDNSLSNINISKAPNDYYGTAKVEDACTPLIIHDGKIHAYTAPRNGTLSGSGDDEATEMFYLNCKISDITQASDFWDKANNYHLGTVPHVTTNGASAVGQGSLTVYHNKIFIFYGVEEKTGETAYFNRVSNIYQTVILGNVEAGVCDYREDIVDNASTFNGFKRLPNGQGIALRREKLHIIGEKMSTNYHLVENNNALNQFIVDGNGGSTGVTIATDGSYGSFYSMSHAGKLSGIKVDNTSGNLFLQSNDTIMIRLEEGTMSMRPASSNTIGLGSATRVWSHIYSQEGNYNNLVTATFEATNTIKLGGLSVTDPRVKDVLWNDGGKVSISAG